MPRGLVGASLLSMHKQWFYLYVKEVLTSSASGRTPFRSLTTSSEKLVARRFRRVLFALFAQRGAVLSHRMHLDVWTPDVWRSRLNVSVDADDIKGD